jgi:hypothetical protein
MAILAWGVIREAGMRYQKVEHLVSVGGQGSMPQEYCVYFSCIWYLALGSRRLVSVEMAWSWNKAILNSGIYRKIINLLW